MKAISIVQTAAVLGVGAALGACAHAPATPMVAPFARVEVFQSGESGIFANAYLVETRNGLVVIDTTLLESTSKALRAKIEATGKPLKAVLITHGHPDHYNGATNVIAGQAVPVISTPGTDRVIREHDAAKEKLWTPVFHEEWPKKRTFPTRTLADGQSIDVDGVRFTVHDLGNGESDSDSYWVMEAGGQKAAFIGDVVLNHVHAYVSDGHTGAWLKNIERLKRELRGMDRIYPGHGDAGGVEMFDWERDYLTTYRETVAALAQGNPRLTDAQKQQLVARMKQFLPNNKLEFLIPLGADAVAAELANAR